MPRTSQDLLFQTSSFFAHFLKASSKSGLESEKVKELYEEVLKPRKMYYEMETLYHLRRKLMKTDEQLPLVDYGSQGDSEKRKKRKISTIARRSVGSVAKHRLLFRLVAYYKPNKVIELGTSLGLSTLYQYFAYEKMQLFTYEGAPALGKFAQNLFKLLEVPEVELHQKLLPNKISGLGGIHQIIGNIDETLQPSLGTIASVDFAYLDANHRYEPTKRYFEMLLPFCNNSAILVFDDIYYSKEMAQAWQEIKQHPKVSATVDLYHVGVVFVGKAHIKTHHFEKL